MARYVWTDGPGHLSPYHSLAPGGTPHITDDDFSYITSEDLEDATASGLYHPRSLSSAPNPPEDDVLIIKSKGATYPVHFPAYCIGDGKLTVRDVRERVGLMMDLSERRTRRVKLLYKGRILKEPAAPVRDYGVKNNSEIMVVIPEMPRDVDGDSIDGSGSGEELVVVTDSPRSSTAGVDDVGRRKKSKRVKKKRRNEGDDVSPQDSSSNLGVPKPQGGGSRTPSPGRAGPMGKLDQISSHFTSKLLPECERFIASPPMDRKKREDEHRRLSETVMQQVLLKYDEVEPDGDEEIRTRRRELVKRVQEVLKRLDEAIQR